jgi:hypothetical protein
VVGLSVDRKTLRLLVLAGEPVAERMAVLGAVRGRLDQLLLGQLEALGDALARLGERALGPGSRWLSV